MQAAIGGDPPAAANRQHQPLAARVGRRGRVALRQRPDDASVAADIHIQVAPAQRAEAGEADQLVGAARQGCGIGTEVDPPGGGLRITAAQSVALTPQPVADVGRIVAAVVADGASRRASRDIDDVAGQVAAGLQQQVAALVRIPGTGKAA